jgi:hypothetical protein
MRAWHSWFGLLGTLALAGLPAQAVGSEFQINTYTTSDQVARVSFSGVLFLLIFAVMPLAYAWCYASKAIMARDCCKRVPNRSSW